MRLLILGGTVFLGRHLVSEALAAGHQVTTLNRGTHSLPEQADVEKLTADREGNLDVLAGRSFDAVIDTCGYQPDVVRRSVTALQDSVGSYVFISSVSAYCQFLKPDICEEDAVKYTPPGEKGDYGTLKADCEKVVIDLMGNRALIVRPGLIVGPHDPTDRFTYWPARVAPGGTILAPGRPERTIQFIDVRDLASWTLHLIETQCHGIYIGDGPVEPLTMSAFLDTCAQAVGSQCFFVWVEDDQLLKSGIEPWSELPLWIPDQHEGFTHFMQLDCCKAFNSGLKPRSLANTIADTLAWDRTRDPAAARKAGLPAEKEWEVLKWVSGSGVESK